MKTSKVVIILQSLSQVELTRFEKFVLSPYFNTHTDTTRLFQLLKKAYPDFKGKEIEKEKVFRKLFPGQPYDDAKLYALKKYLLRLVYEFLSLEKDKQKSESPESLTKALSERNLKRFIPRILSESEKSLDQSPFRNSDYYLSHFQLTSLKAEHAIDTRNRTTSSGLAKSIEALDHYFLGEKLKLACYILTRQGVVGGSNEIKLLDEIISYCQTQEMMEFPSLNIYFHALMMIYQEEGDSYYTEFRNLVSKHQDIFPDQELMSLYTLAINFAAGALQRGETKYRNEVLGIYQDLLQVKSFSSQPAAFILHFKNIVTLGLQLKKYEWTESFIREYKDKLAPDKREGMLHYNLAALDFEKGNHRASIRHLQNMDFVDPLIRINYYVLLLKNYYECEEVEPFLSLCTTFRTFMRRSRSVSEQNRISDINLIIYARKLFKLRLEKKGDIKVLIDEIKSCKLMYSRGWIEEKCAELSESSTLAQ